MGIARYIERVMRPDINEILRGENASSARGASMGRRNVAQFADEVVPLYLQRVRGYDGGDYDAGGAYWGTVNGSATVPPLWCAFEEDGCGVRVYVRAWYHAEAEQAVLDIISEHAEPNAFQPLEKPARQDYITVQWWPGGCDITMPRWMAVNLTRPGKDASLLANRYARENAGVFMVHIQDRVIVELLESFGCWTADEMQKWSPTRLHGALLWVAAGNAMERDRELYGGNSNMAANVTGYVGD